MRRIVALGVLVVISGCNAGEIAKLEAARDERLALRDQLIPRAENLVESAKRARAAKAEFERVSLWRSDGDPAARMTALSSRLGGALASYSRDGSDWKITLTGKGGAAAAMATLARIQGPGFVVTRIDAGAAAWSADLRTRNVEEGGTAAPGSPTLSELPPTGMFPSARRNELQAEIGGLDSEIRALEKIVGEVVELDAWAAAVARELDAVKTDRVRLGRVLDAVAPLFAGTAPLLSSGTVDVTATGYAVRGTCAAGVTGETLAARKPAGWELRSLEGKTIELSR